MTTTPMRALPVLATLFAAAACGGVAPPEAPTPEPAPAAVPGFDTREYPGDDAMQRWLEASPYRWVGYYLPAPCHTGTSWVGKRQTLRAQGWGLAVLYVGEQDWSAAAEGAGTGVAPTESGTEPRCTHTNLTAAKGEADALDADATARAEGFPAGTVIYLDVERVREVSPRLEAYVEAWARALTDAGRYRAGLYAHAQNVAALLPVVRRATGAGGGGVVPLWVATAAGFDLRRPPSASGFPEATVWQGVFDARETWDGITLRIDANVATSDSPS